MVIFLADKAAITGHALYLYQLIKHESELHLQLWEFLSDVQKGHQIRFLFYIFIFCLSLSLFSPWQIFAIFAFSTCGSYSGMFKMSVECKNRSESDLGIEVEFEYPFRYVPCCSTLILLPYVFTVNSKHIHTSSIKTMSTTVYLSFIIFLISTTESELTDIFCKLAHR